MKKKKIRGERKYNKSI